MDSQARGVRYPAWTALMPSGLLPMGGRFPKRLRRVRLDAAEAKRLQRRVRNLGRLESPRRGVR